MRSQALVRHAAGVTMCGRTYSAPATKRFRTGIDGSNLAGRAMCLRPGGPIEYLPVVTRNVDFRVPFRRPPSPRDLPTPKSSYRTRHRFLAPSDPLTVMVNGSPRSIARANTRFAGGVTFTCRCHEADNFVGWWFPLQFFAAFPVSPVP